MSNLRASGAIYTAATVKAKETRGGMRPEDWEMEARKESRAMLGWIVFPHRRKVAR